MHSITKKYLFRIFKYVFLHYLIGMSIKDVPVGDRIISVRELLQADNKGVFGSTRP